MQADPDYLPRTLDFGLNAEVFHKKFYADSGCPSALFKVAVMCSQVDPELRCEKMKSCLVMFNLLQSLCVQLILSLINSILYFLRIAGQHFTPSFHGSKHYICTLISRHLFRQKFRGIPLHMYQN